MTTAKPRGKSKPYTYRAHSITSVEDKLWHSVSRQMDIHPSRDSCTVEDNAARNELFNEAYEAQRAMDMRYEGIEEEAELAGAVRAVMNRHISGRMPDRAYVLKDDTQATTGRTHRSRRPRSTVDRTILVNVDPPVAHAALRQIMASSWSDPDPPVRHMFKSTTWDDLFGGCPVEVNRPSPCLSWYGAFSTYRGWARANDMPLMERSSDDWDHNTLLEPMMHSMGRDSPVQGSHMIRQALFEHNAHHVARAHWDDMDGMERERARSLLASLRASRSRLSELAQTPQVRVFPGCGNPRCIRPSHQFAVSSGELIPWQLPVVTLNAALEAHKANIPRKADRLPQPTSFDHTRRNVSGPGNTRYSRNELPVDDLAWGMARSWWLDAIPRMGRVAEHPAGMETIMDRVADDRAVPSSVTTREELWRFMSGADRHGEAAVLPYAVAEAGLWGSR